MRDPAHVYTKKGTPLLLIGSRILFAAYFVFAIFSLEARLFPESNESYVWVLYLLGLYYLMERIYVFFSQKNIDLAFAFPLLFAMYAFNLASVVLNAQERFPLMNRAEHLLSFVLMTYIVWTFFIKYLPQQVWSEHPYYTSLLVFSVTSTFGVANELAELLFDSMFQTNLIGRQMDTSLDLLMNTLGITLFLSVRLILGSADLAKK
jgi:hypothetical protein